MSLYIPEYCPRDCSDCYSLAQIISDSEIESFVCCGLNDGTRRALQQDKFTVCFKNAVIDSIEHWDYQDMKDMMSVLAQALSADHHLQNAVNEGE